jgi:hypothetical protein
VYNLSAGAIAGLQVATDQLGFPSLSSQQALPPWGQFVQLGNGLIGLTNNYAGFPEPFTLYVSPDGIQVGAAESFSVVWRYYIIDGQSSSTENTYDPISASVIADTLVYMQTIMLNEMTSAGAPILTVT